MQPSPMPETSRLPAPRLRFCIVITPLLQNPAEPDGNGTLRSELLLTHSKDTECRSGCAFPILPILCLILSNVLILCTFRLASSTLRKEEKTSDKACTEDRHISNGSGHRISQQERSACSIGRRAFNSN